MALRDEGAHWTYRLPLFGGIWGSRERVLKKLRMTIVENSGPFDLIRNSGAVALQATPDKPVDGKGLWMSGETITYRIRNLDPTDDWEHELAVTVTGATDSTITRSPEVVLVAVKVADGANAVVTAKLGSDIVGETARRRVVKPLWGYVPEDYPEYHARVSDNPFDPTTWIPMPLTPSLDKNAHPIVSRKLWRVVEPPQELSETFPVWLAMPFAAASLRASYGPANGLAVGFSPFLPFDRSGSPWPSDDLVEAERTEPRTQTLLVRQFTDKKLRVQDTSDVVGVYQEVDLTGFFLEWTPPYGEFTTVPQAEMVDLKPEWDDWYDYAKTVGLGLYTAGIYMTMTGGRIQYAANSEVKRTLLEATTAQREKSLAGTSMYGIGVGGDPMSNLADTSYSFVCSGSQTNNPNVSEFLVPPIKAGHPAGFFTLDKSPQRMLSGQEANSFLLGTQAMVTRIEDGSWTDCLVWSNQPHSSGQVGPMKGASLRTFCIQTSPPGIGSATAWSLEPGQNVGHNLKYLYSVQIKPKSWATWSPPVEGDGEATLFAWMAGDLNVAASDGIDVPNEFGMSMTYAEGQERTFKVTNVASTYPILQLFMGIKGKTYAENAAKVWTCTFDPPVGYSATIYDAATVQGMMDGSGIDPAYRVPGYQAVAVQFQVLSNPSDPAHAKILVGQKIILTSGDGESITFTAQAV